MTGGIPGVPTVSFGNGALGVLAGAVPEGATPAGTVGCACAGSCPAEPLAGELLPQAASVNIPASTALVTAMPRVNERFLISASNSAWLGADQRELDAGRTLASDSEVSRLLSFITAFHT